MKKVIALVMVITFLASLCACGGSTNKGQDTSGIQQQSDTQAAVRETGEVTEDPGIAFPLKEKTKLVILTHEGYGRVDPPNNDKLAYKELEKLTNVEIEWQSVPNTKYAEVVSTRFAAGADLPDIALLTIPGDRFTSLIRDGIIIPLSDKLPQYAPRLNKLFTDNRAAYANYVFEDGKVYTFPDAKAMEKEWQVGTLINSKWLDNLGLKVPETTDDFYNVLKEFKLKDPNQNGEADEIPLCADSLMDYMGNAWGLQIGTTGGSGNFFQLDENGNVACDFASPRIKEYFEYLNKLYKENLLDKEFSVNTLDTIKEKIGKDKVGAMNWFVGMAVTWNLLYDANGQTAVFRPIKPLTGPHGDMYNLKRPSISGSWGITNVCKNPELALAFLDLVFLDEKVNDLFFWGVEGVTYEIKDGVKNYLVPKDQLLKEGFTSWHLPIVQSSEVIDIANKLITPYDKEYMRPYFKDPFPIIPLTPKESEIYNKYWTDIWTYFQEMRFKFITGEEPFENFEKYKENLQKLKLDEITKVYQSMYDRYKEITK